MGTIKKTEKNNGKVGWKERQKRNLISFEFSKNVIEEVEVEINEAR